MKYPVEIKEVFFVKGKTLFPIKSSGLLLPFKRSKEALDTIKAMSKGGEVHLKKRKKNKD